MPLLLADLIYSRDCKLNLRKNVDTTDYNGTPALGAKEGHGTRQKGHGDRRVFELPYLWTLCYNSI